ncbi:MAG: aminotransferase [Actinophytocola sp.]|uniref:aminotransferase n=1 Tax=Actinophytocola sp. TaxID=1872138 RepID=UPI003D6B3720
MQPNRRTAAQIDSPIRTTYALLDRRAGRRPLLDMAQAAPSYPPAPELRQHVAEIAQRTDSGGYVAIEGLPRLREAFAADLRAGYPGDVDPADVLVTAGCNQAFCLTASALADPGDEFVVALPYYFNHDMWLKLQGFEPVYVEPGPDHQPSVPAAKAAITSRTKAILLVSPGNPSGVTIAPDTLAAFATLAASRGLALIVDETYRSFRDTTEPAHALFTRPRWRDTVISLHSFSKDLAIPGYRAGALVASPALIRQIAKLADCVAICAPRISQEAAWAGLTRAGTWRRERAREVAEKAKAFASTMAGAPGGFELVTHGAYFGWVRHPFPDRPTGDVVADLIVRHDLLAIPGTAFLPDDRRMIRMSFANLEPTAFADLTDRLVAAGVRST